MKVLFAIACIVIGVYFLFLVYRSYRVSKNIKLDIGKRTKARYESKRRLDREFRGATRVASTNRDNGSDALVLASALSVSEGGSSGSYSGGYSSGCSGASSSSSDSGSSSCSSD